MHRINKALRVMQLGAHDLGVTLSTVSAIGDHRQWQLQLLLPPSYLKFFNFAQPVSVMLYFMALCSYTCSSCIVYNIRCGMSNIDKVVEKLVPSSSVPGCQVCGKEALFQCSECQQTYYCSRDHQFDHWKQGHKKTCKVTKPETEETDKKILEVRKSYYENYSHRQFAECLLDAKVLVGLQRKRLQVTPSMNHELDYGGTVCLLTKTYLLLNDRKSAKQELQSYMKEKEAMVFDMKDVPSIKQKDSVKEKYYDQLQKRLNLISCIGNLSYATGMDCISYYVLYTKIIMTFFGPDSYEASNCYFLVGCYYAEEGYFKKAIECFQKSNRIRRNFGGDCLFNIGILYKLQGELPKALETLENALRLRTEQYGEDSNKVAEISEIMGIIYTELNDFKTALNEYEHAYKLRAVEPQSAQFQNVIELIEQLYEKLKLFIESGQPRVKKPDIYINLKAYIESKAKEYLKDPKYKRLSNDTQEAREIRQKEVIAKKEEEKQRNRGPIELTLQLTEEFTSKLGLNELYRLSELQLELERCDSQFSVIYTIGTSPFYTSLCTERYEELEKMNPRLFEMIKLEHLKHIRGAQS